MLIKELMNLMVGDILMAYHDDGESQRNFPVIVDGIDANGTLVDGECYISWKPLQKEDCEEDYADEMNPIPLTAEILEKNGFEIKRPENSKRTYWIIHCNGGQARAHMNRNMLYFEMDGVFKIGYFTPRFYGFVECIHELQHALRLCGLTELADNFKI